MHLNRPPRPKRSFKDKAEDQAWADIYRRIRRDANLASEVLLHLESDPESKRNHLALYLACRQSLQRRKLRQQRNKRLAQLIRSCAEAISGLWDALTGAGDDLSQIARELRRGSGHTAKPATRRTRTSPVSVTSASEDAQSADSQRFARTG